MSSDNSSGNISSNKISRRVVLKSAALGAAALGIPNELRGLDAAASGVMEAEFLEPPEDARPWVYWYFMDGHLTRAGMDADLAAMKKAGLGGGIFLEVGIGLEPGPVEFMSEPWQALLGHAFEEADRLGLEIALAAGPGWCGTGGPWVKPGESMQHLVSSSTVVEGPVAFDAVLPQPAPRTPFFGVDTLSPELLKAWKEFYEDEFVLAFPTPRGEAMIPDVDEKALYTRGSYSSQIPGPYTKRPWVRPFLPDAELYGATTKEACVDSHSVVNLTGKLAKDGRLAWTVPAGRWTIMRFGRTITGQTTRPSPKPGLGLESDKFSIAAMDAHFERYIASLLKRTGTPQHAGRGLVAIHFDSWEMSSQNWSHGFELEFKRRRGYDPTQYLPAFTGAIVDSPEVSERFLWDVRQTANELVCENQARRLRERSKQHGLWLALEPYDLNPAADLDLGAVADIPMGEFWSKTSNPPTTDFSLAEAASVGHTCGRKVIGAEAFTAAMEERGHQHPASMKAQGDWAFCQGINKFVIHRYQAQPWLDRFPGMTMGTNGGYGVHWDRTQTWWDFVPAYHQYLTRCQQMLRRGLFVADILYLNPEGAPSVFFPPRSAFRAGLFPDHRGYNFDGCSPETLIARASVREGRIVFPDGMSYRLLVLPRSVTMTPRLMRKIMELVEAGASVLGAPPLRSPSLAGYPECDEELIELAAKLWPRGETARERAVGKGRVYLDEGAGGEGEEDPLAKAKWIWPAREAASARFARTIAVAEPEKIDTAVVTITSDKSYVLEVNGRFVLSANTTERVRRMDIGCLLRAGTNELSVMVKGNKDRMHRGLIAALEIGYRDGKKVKIGTDSAWSCRTEDGGKVDAMEIGAWDAEPWKLTDASVEQEDIYPSYAVTAEILRAKEVEEDFVADVPLRWIHRVEGGIDFFFLANGEAEAQSGKCRFRITGKRPEWWNPITGERRELPQFSESGGHTEIPIRLEAFESGFVVFREPIAKRAGARSENFPSLTTVARLDAPWEVAFDTKWGGPERVVFNRLDDWTRRPEPEIRNYSGKATYNTTFDCAELAVGRRTYLSLGKVANIASVKLNDRELGVVWCEPWRIAIPDGVLRTKDNKLEVVVANLWCNRLIADSGLPEKERLTWTTSNPFHPNDTLLESGLLGPVGIEAAGLKSM